jgi:hypothetical protein
MFGTDMVLWSAENTTELSLCQDLYSVGHTHPTVDATNSYTTQNKTVNGSYIDFLVFRDLTPSNASDYVITLGDANTMIWAYGNYSATTLPTTTANITYHGSTQHSTTWILTIDSNATVTSSGDNGLTPTPTPPTPTPTPVDGVTEVLVLDNGSTLSMGYDSITGLVHYYAHVL